MRTGIRIENPASGPGFTSGNRARRFVAQGRAEWVEPGVSIRFIQSDHRHTSARRSVEQTALAYDQAARRGMAQIVEVANLPAVQPWKLLGMSRPERGGRRPARALCNGSANA